MKAKTKAARDRKAAQRIAEIMYSALQKFPKEEHENIIAAVEAVEITKNENTSKPRSTRANPREYSMHRAAARKRGRP